MRFTFPFGRKGMFMEMVLFLLRVFAVGGAFCLVAQLLIDLTKLTPARILVLYVVLGVFLGGIGVYDALISFAGCGATTPLCGFGYLLCKGVRDGVRERGLLGAFVGGLGGCAGGITAAMSFGYLFALFFRGKSK